MMRILAYSIAFVLAAAAFVPGQENKSPIPRDAFRYDGKPFSYWETYPRTELKAERRIDALRAMVAFGTRGYAKEATTVIVELLNDYECDNCFSFNIPDEPDKGTPDQRISYEAFSALARIGADASPIVAAHLDRKVVRYFATGLYSGHWGKAPPSSMSEDSAPALVRRLRSQDKEASEIAVVLLKHAVHQEASGRGKKVEAAFLAAVEKDRCEEAVIEVLKRNCGYGAPLLGAFGPRAKSAVPALIVEELNGSEDAVAALKKIGLTPAERVNALRAALPGDRKRAAAKLGEMGADARDAAGDLVAILKKPMPDPKEEEAVWSAVNERTAVVEAYVKIVDANESRPVVAELLERNTYIQFDRVLVRSYLKVDNDPKRTAVVLAKAMQRLADSENGLGMLAKGEPMYLRLTSVSAVSQHEPPTFLGDLTLMLGTQGKHAAGSVPALLRAYKGCNEDDKIGILNALGKMGPAAREALPMLEAQAKSDRRDVQQAAANAIRAISKRE